MSLLAAPAAFAQGGPSFDCAKASNAVERTICKDPELAKADREMAAAYAALAAKLSGPAKDNLEKEQVRWIGDRNRGCAADTDGIAPCLKRRYAARTTNLLASAEGIYPFISEQSLSKNAKLGKITYSYDIALSEVRGHHAPTSPPSMRASPMPRKKAVADATPQADSGLDREQEWTYEQSFMTYRPGAQRRHRRGGFLRLQRRRARLRRHQLHPGRSAHGQGRGPRRRVRGGRQVAARPWSRSSAPTSRSSSSRSPASRKRWSPPSLAKLLREPAHYCWRANRLELIFNAYDVGPYAAGPFEVYVSYDRLAPLLRKDGPITR